MTRRAALSLAAAAVAACAAVCAVEETGGLEGTVRDEKGSPLAGATVKVEHTVRQQTFAFETKADGSYAFPQLAPGVYSLYAVRANYCSVWIRKVIVTAGRTTRQEVTLPADPGCRPAAPPRRQ